MNKKGFVIIETIVTVVVLTTSLLYLYNSYSTIINREEARLNYDDLSYVYRTNYIRNFWKTIRILMILNGIHLVILTLLLLDRLLIVCLLQSKELKICSYL